MDHDTEDSSYRGYVPYQEYQDQIATLVEVRGVYDGWSAALLTDGTIVNRWDPEVYPQRHTLTQEYLVGSPLLGDGQNDTTFGIVLPDAHPAGLS